MLVEGCPQECSGQVEALLHGLHPLFGEEEEPGARDNAAGAVSRLLLAYGGALPLEQILPVLLKVLPPQVRRQGGVVAGFEQAVCDVIVVVDVTS
jgi:hypothetical protein